MIFCCHGGQGHVLRVVEVAHQISSVLVAIIVTLMPIGYIVLFVSNKFFIDKIHYMRFASQSLRPYHLVFPFSPTMPSRKSTGVSTMPSIPCAI
jgi:hypothetical protein